MAATYCNRHVVFLTHIIIVLILIMLMVVHYRWLVGSIIDLGITVDSRLKFDKHIALIVH